MKRKEALRYIEENLKIGSTREELFRDLSSKVTFQSDLIQYMAEIPLLSKKKYKNYNNLLLVLLLIIFIVKLFFFFQLVRITQSNTTEMLPGLILGGWFHFLQPFLVIYIAAGVWKFRGKFYLFILFLGAMEILNQLGSISALTSNTKALFIWAIMLFPVLISMVLSWLILKKMFPFMAFKKISKERLLSYTD